MGARTRTATWAVMTVMGGVSLVACTPDDSPPADVDDEAVEADVEVPTVSPPPSRQTPFCQAMLDLDDELPADPAVDATEQILTAYRAAQPIVPPVIAAEFAAVIQGLETGTVVTLPPPSVPPTVAPPDQPADNAGESVTEDTFFEEGYLPDDNPATRVNAYIDFACRGVQNNPGPPATQPAAPPSTGEI